MKSFKKHRGVPGRMEGLYDTLGSPEAVAALQENYGAAGAIYKFWADWPDVLTALVVGWEVAGTHPAQLHYAWDLEEHRSLKASLEQTTRTAAEYLQLEGRAAPRILDAGCGFGGCVTQLAREHAEWTVTGVTIVHDQAYIATQRAGRQHLANASILVANYLDLPRPDASFDGALAIETFCHVPAAEKRQLAGEMHWLLAPGDRLVIFDGYEGTLPNSARVDYERFLRGLALPRLTSPDETREQFEAAGFHTVRAEDVTSRIAASAKLAGDRARFFRPLIKRCETLSGSRVLRPALRAAGWDAASALAFADAAVSQEALFTAGYLRYVAYVFER
jgi:cyclopropane fatty-acyl-phospholipid synthase-like methyltransferase